MSELKKCPICGATLKIYSPEDWKPTFYDPDSGGDPYNAVCDCGFQYSSGSYDYAEFVAALNRRAQPANESLTLDELRGMDGEPVWVTHKDGSGGRWGIVNSYKGTGMCADLDSYTAYWFDDWCGTIAYRRKPEGSETDGQTI